MKSLCRQDTIQAIAHNVQWDCIVIGGGASGLGVALDAVSRGFSCLLIEKEDFGSGTSSKSTKLVHGGVRYLAQGYISLVIEALRERSYILHRASHIADVQPFIIPIYSWYEAAKYYLGLKIYDLLSIHKSLGKTQWMSKDRVHEVFPQLKTRYLKGGVVYTDGKFDDARLCIDLVHTITLHGGYCINYFMFQDIVSSEDTITGIIAKDTVNNQSYHINAKVVINATGVFSGDIFQKAHPNVPLRIAASRGSHIVCHKTITDECYGLMIPQTSDGRVLFAIPWKNKLLAGTTDIPQQTIEQPCNASADEVKFILQNLNTYFGNIIEQSDIAATFAGLRPLAAPKNENQKTKEISRSHKVLVAPNQLISIIGGKWTTFRKMGSDTMDTIIKYKLLDSRASTSENIFITPITSLDIGEFIHEELPYSLEYFEECISNEMVEHLDDVLSRRTRCTFICMHATKQIYVQVLAIMARIKQWDALKSEQEKINFEQTYFQ